MGNSLTTQKPPPAEQQQNSESFTCEICIEPINIIEKFESPNNNCRPHTFCMDCMVKYIQAKLDDNVSKIPCPALNCAQFLDPHACRTLVGPNLFVKWCDSLCESAMMAYPRSHCPNRNCSELIVDECGGGVKKSTCPRCKEPFCFQCKIPWHAGFSCEESEELRDENDRAFGLLAERKGWKRCPSCHHFVSFNGPCIIVHCRCGASFCNICGKQAYQNWCTCIHAMIRRSALGCASLMAIFVIFFFVVFLVIKLK